MGNVLTMDDVHYSFGERHVLAETSLAIEQGKVISIIGPNGSGKSTMLRVFAKLLSPEQGAVYFGEQNIAQLTRKALAQKMTMLPQVQKEASHLTVRDLVQFGRSPHLKWYESLSADDEEIIEWALSVTKMAPYASRFLQQLSGGERQRAWIAMALAQRPSVLLLDEPTTYLDIAHQLEVMELVRSLNEQYNMTIVMVLHDINQAAKYADELVVVKDGTIYQQGTPGEVMTEAMFRDVFQIKVNVHEVAGTPHFMAETFI